MKNKNLIGLIALFLPLLLSCAGNTSSENKGTSSDTTTAAPENEPAPSWKLGVALYSFNRFPFSATLDKADSAGVDYVEGFDFHTLGEGFSAETMISLPDPDLEKIQSLLSNKGMEMPSLYVGSAESAGDWIDYFELGKKLGVDFFVCEPEKEHWDLLDSLAGAYDIKIAIHEHARGKSQYWHPDSVLAAMEGRPNIGACADLGHWVRSGIDPVEALQKLSGRVISVHAKDLDEFGNIDATDVKIGSGVIDYAAVTKELKNQDFDGFIYIECEHDWLDNLGDVSFGIQYLDSIATSP